MSIKKIVDVKEFSDACGKLNSLFKEENKKYGHRYLPISAKSIVNAWGHASFLYHTMHVWVSFSEEKPDGIIMFLEHINPTFGEKVFTEYFWISKNPQKSFTLFKTALKYAKKRKIKYAFVSCVENHPKSLKLQKVYQKLGFLKDSSTYIKKL